MKYSDEIPVPPSGKRLGLRKTWPAYSVFILALALTFTGWRMVNEQVETKLSSLFAEDKDQIINRAQSAFDQQKEVLRSFQNLYASNVEVVRDVFELFAAVPEKMYPGIQKISYAPYISDNNKKSFIEYARSIGYQNYEISPEGNRPGYFPIEFMVPFELNVSQLGYDLSSEPEIESTIKIAFQQRMIIASPLRQLAGSSEKGFLLIAPISTQIKRFSEEINADREFSGICIIEIRAEEFLKSTLDIATDSSNVAVEIFDGSNRSSSNLIYAQSPVKNSIMMLEETIEIAGRTWLFSFSAKEELTKRVNLAFPWYVLFGGITMSFLLFAFIYALLTSRFRALELAARMTRSQRRIVESSQDLISVIGFDGKWKSMNQASKTVILYQPEEMIGRSHTEFLFPPDREPVLATIGSAPDEQPVEFEARYVSKNGSVRWLSWSATSSQKDHLVYMIGRDITDKKNADTQIRLKNRQLDLAGLIADRENLCKESAIREQSKEFRTQLTGTLGFLQLVLSDPELTNEEIKEFVRTANTGAQDLLNAVQKMMEVSLTKSQDIAFDMQHVEVSSFFHAAKTSLIETALKNNIHVRDRPILFDSLGVCIDMQKFERSWSSILYASFENLTDGMATLDIDKDENAQRIYLLLHINQRIEIPALFSQSNAESLDPRLIMDEMTFPLVVSRLFIEVMDGEMLCESNPDEFVLKITFPIAIT